jgi:hypothetical protein
MWNGPTWPHANSLVMSGMAETLRRYPGSPLTPAKLLELFGSATRAQIKDGDPPQPWTGEFYRGDTGQWKTAERDYFHSTWIDILIGDLIGLRPRADDLLEIHPLLEEETWSFWELRDVAYHGHRVAISWHGPQARGAAGSVGLTIEIDGEVRHRQPDLSPVTLPLAR